MSTLYTIGHSTHTLQDIISLLHTYHITHVVDIRLIPKSRYVPWFNENTFKQSLKKEKMDYIHMPVLGGFRSTHPHSINQGWKNTSFRGFADYMQTPAFFIGFKQLNQLIKQKNNHIVIMCAEAVPWRCHRSLIADAEVIRGIKVLHILSATSVRQHTLTAFAKIDKSTRPIQLFYPK